MRERSARLHRDRDQPLLAIVALDRDLGVGERLLDLAGVELPDVALVRPEVVVHERSVGIERAADVGDRSEWLVLDLDELRGVLRDLPRVSATTTATPSPTCRALSNASGKCDGILISSVTGQAHGSEPAQSAASSAPLNAATTPSSSRAAFSSTSLDRARARTGCGRPTARAGRED